MIQSTKSYKAYTYSFSSILNSNSNKKKDGKAINNDSKRTNIREILRKERRKVLESIYKLNPYPCKDARRQISQQLQMDPREFQIWFQNRRSRDKRKTKLIPINTGLQWISTIKPSYFLKLYSSLSPKMNSNNSNSSPSLPSQINFESNSNITDHTISSFHSSSTKCTRMSLSYLLL